MVQFYFLADDRFSSQNILSAILCHQHFSFCNLMISHVIMFICVSCTKKNIFQKKSYLSFFSHYHYSMSFVRQARGFNKIVQHNRNIKSYRNLTMNKHGLYTCLHQNWVPSQYPKVMIFLHWCTIDYQLYVKLFKCDNF